MVLNLQTVLVTRGWYLRSPQHHKPWWSGLTMNLERTLLSHSFHTILSSKVTAVKRYIYGCLFLTTDSKLYITVDAFSSLAINVLAVYKTILHQCEQSEFKFRLLSLTEAHTTISFIFMWCLNQTSTIVTNRRSRPFSIYCITLLVWLERFIFQAKPRQQRFDTV